MSDDEPETKTLSGFLVVDWDDETMRVRQTRPEPTKRGRTEVVIPVSLDVHVPEMNVPSLTGEVEVPAPEVDASLDTEGDA